MKTGSVEHIIEDPSVGKVLTTVQFDPKTKSLIGLGYTVLFPFTFLMSHYQLTTK
jgi:hypothetical protein